MFGFLFETAKCVASRVWVIYVMMDYTRLCILFNTSSVATHHTKSVHTLICSFRINWHYFSSFTLSMKNRWQICFLLIKEGHSLKLLWSLSLNTVDVPTTKLIAYMGEPLELLMMTTPQLFINYLSWTNLSVFTIKISRFHNWNLQGSSWYFCEQSESIICEKRKCHKLMV